MDKRMYTLQRVYPISIASLLALFSSTIEIFYFNRIFSGSFLLLTSFVLYILKISLVASDSRLSSLLKNSTKIKFSKLINYFFLPATSYIILFILSQELEQFTLASLFGLFFFIILFLDDVLVLTEFEDLGDSLRVHYIFDVLKIFNILIVSLLVLKNVETSLIPQLLLVLGFVLFVFVHLKVTIYKSDQLNRLTSVMAVLVSMLLGAILYIFIFFKEAADINLALLIIGFYIISALFLQKAIDKEINAGTIFRFLLAFSTLILLALTA